MSTVERAAEGVARALTRRRFLNRAAGVVFGAAAAAAVGGLRPGVARATHATCPNPNNPGGCNCIPLGGYYCNQFSASYCNGAACSGGCTYNGISYPNDYCWCTALCDYNCGTCASYIGYWVCCDCTCPGNRYCTCRTFVRTCSSQFVPSRTKPGLECIPCC